ncbi:ribonuclease catalytic domain-containing protein [Xylophilus sp. GOD-11R]|uniref:ribonuclease catalytic domain-containing protein n=1 Tax=Xylophilus sp. GOD-11R TaxID=3089814 RepID=UPI00298BDB00|nr:RNB domain-containing ribonuclease [Xylophilus sp. GOD-11R]WPB56180.1 RNB domain-containing ribonuclease [Xylophilus sp. GOD-11R]
MYALFEEAGKFLAGRILSEAESSAQVELASGKRVKVKAANLLLKFEKPDPEKLLADARSLAEGIELEMAYEFAPDEEFGFAELAQDYFSAAATITEQSAMLVKLFEAPHYFRRAGKGRFRKAAPEIVQQALLAIERKKAQAQQIADWAEALAAGQAPQSIRDELYKILFKPDKNTSEYKAVVEASRATQTAPLDLLRRAGAIASPYQFHWKRFLFDHFPKGIGFPGSLEAPPVTEELPLAEGVAAFSIDDSQTTEIDDALSVQGLGSGSVTVGVHIAAPGLAFTPGGALDQVARQRLSTVYMPGHKITMLPDAIVQTYTLGAGQARPAVSLYVTLDEATLAVTASETRLERVPVVANLRHDRLDDTVTEQWLTDPASPPAAPAPEAEALRAEMSFLFRLARHLKAAREVVRGKPENFNRPDYNFRLESDTDSEPVGDETVRITVRRRGAPLDLIVAEAMILANSTWGSWLGDLGVPGIYRSQASMAPGVKVRMGTKALPHAGIGVPSYAWSTSPLRRYVDLVNQWQIIAAARHGRTAALAAPFKPKDAELFSIISSFDAAYSAYNGYQAAMERFWTLQYLRQNGIAELTASVIKEGPAGSLLVRADELPLVLPVLGAQSLPRGARVRVKLGEIDDIALDVGGTVVERLDAAPVDEGDDAGADEEEAMAAGPIAIAVDVDDAQPQADAPAAA